MKKLLIPLIAGLIASAWIGTSANPEKKLARATSTPLPSVNLIVDGFSSSSKPFVVANQQNHSDEPPFMNGEPQHVRVVFDHDKLADYTDYLQRQLLVYPVKEYAQLFKGKEKTAFQKNLSDLQVILSAQSDRGIKQIPILPAAEAYEALRSRVQYLRFRQGSGVAFVACYAQDEAPIKNGDLFYTFQGLTNDRRYWVSFFCPVTVATLLDNKSSKQAAAFLGKLPNNKFSPNLDTVNSMLRSLNLNVSTADISKAK